MPFFPGCACRVPSIDPQLIQRDVTNKGHDWSEFEPIIYQENSSWYLPPRAGHYTCKKCGMIAFSMCAQDFDTCTVKNGIKITKAGRPPFGVALEPKPEKLIMTWIPGNHLEDSLYSMSCDELFQDKLWVATIDDEERLRKINYYKDDPAYKGLVKAYESLNYGDKIYEFGGFKVNIGDGRATFVANTVAARKIAGIVGVHVEER